MSEESAVLNRGTAFAAPFFLGAGSPVRLFFQRAQHFLIHIPLLQNGENSFAAKTCPSEVSKNACRLFPICWFFKPLATQVLSGLVFVIHLIVGRRDGVLDDLSMNA